jgi:hypothetical protein
MSCIRRMNLDAFWSRSCGTVRGNRDKLRMGLGFSESVGLHGPYIHEGPLPSYDHCGYEVAIQLILYSRRPGINNKAHVQFETIRKLRSVYGNQVRSSSQGNRQSLVMCDVKGRYTRLTNDPCGSFWFSRWLEGCRYRMGQDWKPNQAMSIELLLEVLKETEVRVSDSSTLREYNRWVTFHSFVVVTYVLSLRGPEGFLLDLGQLRKNWFRSEESHLLVGLRGKIKGEHHHRVHLIPCVKVTLSGIDVEASLRRMMKHKGRLGLLDGPAISDENKKGMMCTPRELLMIVCTMCWRSSSTTTPSCFLRTYPQLRNFVNGIRRSGRFGGRRILELRKGRCPRRIWTSSIVGKLSDTLRDRDLKGP